MKSLVHAKWPTGVFTCIYTHTQHLAVNTYLVISWTWFLNKCHIFVNAGICTILIKNMIVDIYLIFDDKCEISNGKY